ncbi:uncharacterized protein C8Q71DRAFT_494746 [Rhodofomes roseus]|uniref:Uncharacterized protein n=1 Tax=Rhodofomes roseus TaxID=34475 RepID=A0ABQ8KLY5_9APHY|nr:uncharacterized protein C8Q71DRAFT_494746 [Rhodofomes roseus]KAH9839080.1 hypothetical protein C8Q71DRAFT_494746 [Rhodofomes roseus]
MSILETNPGNVPGLRTYGGHPRDARRSSRSCGGTSLTYVTGMTAPVRSRASQASVSNTTCVRRLRTPSWRRPSLPGRTRDRLVDDGDSCVDSPGHYCKDAEQRRGGGRGSGRVNVGADGANQSGLPDRITTTRQRQLVCQTQASGRLNCDTVQMRLWRLSRLGAHLLRSESSWCSSSSSRHRPLLNVEPLLYSGDDPRSPTWVRPPNHKKTVTEKHLNYHPTVWPYGASAGFAMDVCPTSLLSPHGASRIWECGWPTWLCAAFL